MKYIQWFEDLEHTAVATAGGKGGNLGEMTRARLPVPPGFVVTADAFERFIHEGDLLDLIGQRLSYLRVDDTDALNVTANDLQEWVRRAPIPDDIRRAIDEAYATLNRCEETDAEWVAVRPSDTAEDAAAAASFDGMFQTFLNVRGAGQLLDRVRDCWASLFSARSIAYRARQGMLLGPQVAVVVQKMVNAEKSGLLFTVDPASGNMNHIVIEAAWGLGELIVQGDVRPDRYVVDKRDLRLVERVVSRKDFAVMRTESGETERVPLDETKARGRVLSDDEVLRLAELAILDEQHYRAPQDVEWAMAGGHVYFVQTRTITSVAPRLVQEPVDEGEALIRGLSAGPAAQPLASNGRVPDGAVTAAVT